MIQRGILASISDEDLFVTVQRLTARSNVALANLLAHLGEVERRGIHRVRACASLYTYCVYELRMSEDAAYRRAKAARLVREFPELHDAIAKGEIHLTGVLMIGPYLGGEHHAELLRRARFRSKRELLRVIAEIDPKPEVPALVEPIGPAPSGPATHRAFVEALSGPVRDLPAGSRPEDWIVDLTECARRCDDPAEGSEALDAEQSMESAELETPVDATEHQRALRYKVQFTASQEFVDLLEEASDLIGHETPHATLPEIQLRALRALVQQLRGRKRGATKVPAPPARDSSRASEAPAQLPRVATDATQEQVFGVATDTAPARIPGVEPIAAPARIPPAATVAAPARRGTRHIPASVRRAVCDRDAERCAYRDDRGARCRETRGLEIHHRNPYALGGPPTLDNLELRCRPHNTLAAEEDFGREHMDLVRGVRRQSRDGE